MNECKHNMLIRLVGAIHPSGKDYQCQECKELLRVEATPLTITVTKGRPTP